MTLGNTSSIKWFDGMGEYVIDWGPGYRIYLAKDGDTLIVLFGGGTKRGQQRDIDRAKELLGVWAAEGFKNRTENFDLSERLRLRYFEVTKGSSTPENIVFRPCFLLPPRLLAEYRARKKAMTAKSISKHKG